MSYDAAEDTCSIKYVDYGGYDVIPTDQLKQIRTDFLSLPFQVCGKHFSIKASVCVVGEKYKDSFRLFYCLPVSTSGI